LTVWMRRTNLIKDARLYLYAGILPVQPAPSDEKGAPNGPAGRQRR
jgi:hypothetical protein